MRRVLHHILRGAAIILMVGAALLLLSRLPEKAQAGFNPNNLISDGTFIDINSLDTNGISEFLRVQNSYLKDFSENGRSAAQIIRDASHGYGDASGSINGITINAATGTVNPQVILVTLQKEQSLISRTTRDDNALRKAMGYGCPDSGSCNAAYAGFTKQVENAAWQFRYNYERASGHGFGDYQVGQSFSFSDWNGTHAGRFGNRATASLYRYTPHVYNGNYNFYNLFNGYFVQKAYNAQFAGQYRTGNSLPGYTTAVWVKFRNVGTATWYSRGPNPVRLALDKYWASSTAWRGSGWISQSRLATAQEGNIAPGQTGTFRFNIKVPNNASSGSHRFYARLVAENLTWFDNPKTNGGAWWQINLPTPQATHAGQSRGVTAWPGQTANLQVKFRNVSGYTWHNSGRVPVNLAIDRLADENFLKTFRYSNWVSAYRPTTMSPPDVANGQIATFNFTIRIPQNIPSGSYRFNVRLVQDSYAWFEPDINGAAWFQITVPKAQAEHAGQIGYPTLSRGQSTNLWVKFKNTSGVPWRTSGPSPVSLALDHYWTSSTAWRGSGWISQSRLATAQEGNIAPGQTGTFRFNIHVPNTMPSGIHRFYVRLVADGYSWFDNPKTNGAGWWEIIVR